MNDKPKRRSFQFSLRTMLMMVTLVCIGFGVWVHRSREWIRQRQEWLATHDYDPAYGTTGIPTGIPPPPGQPYLPTAPGGLWLFGEKGLSLAIVDTAEDEQAAKQLFPEASVNRFPMASPVSGAYDLPDIPPLPR